MLLSADFFLLRTLLARRIILWREEIRSRRKTPSSAGCLPTVRDTLNIAVVYFYGAPCILVEVIRGLQASSRNRFREIGCARLW